MIARWKAMAEYIDLQVSILRRGVKAGKVSIRAQVERTIAEIDELEKMPVEQWALAKPALNPPSSWSSGERAQFSKALMSSVNDGVKPALLRYRDMLRSEVLP